MDPVDDLQWRRWCGYTTKVLVWCEETEEDRTLCVSVGPEHSLGLFPPEPSSPRAFGCGRTAPDVWDDCRVRAPTAPTPVCILVCRVDPPLRTPGVPPSVPHPLYLSTPSEQRGVGP